METLNESGKCGNKYGGRITKHLTRSPWRPLTIFGGGRRGAGGKGGESSRLELAESSANKATSKTLV